MCNLYAMTRKEDDLARFFLVPTTRRTAFQPLHEAVAPKWIGLDLIVADIGDGLGARPGCRRMRPMSLGPVRAIRRDPHYRCGVAREDRFDRRYLVAASCLCEPNGDVKPQRGRLSSTIATLIAAFLHGQDLQRTWMTNSDRCRNTRRRHPLL
jgi:hypothetical protein